MQKPVVDPIVARTSPRSGTGEVSGTVPGVKITLLGNFQSSPRVTAITQYYVRLSNVIGRSPFITRSRKRTSIPPSLAPCRAHQRSPPLTRSRTRPPRRRTQWQTLASRCWTSSFTRMVSVEPAQACLAADETSRHDRVKHAIWWVDPSSSGPFRSNSELTQCSCLPAAYTRCRQGRIKIHRLQ